MKTLWATLQTTPAVLHWVAALCLIALLAKMLWLNDLPPAFHHAYDLGQLAENLLAATIAAYIFLVISVQLPQVIERRQVGPMIIDLSQSVATTILGFLMAVNYSLKGVKGQSKLDIANVTEDQVHDLFSKVNPTARSAIGALDSPEAFTWMQAMIAETERCKTTIDQVWRYVRFIDAELGKLLNDISGSTFIEAKQEMKILLGNASTGNPDLSVWSSHYFECFKTARRLQEYCEPYRAVYGLKSTGA
jgi:hypothetical protein